MGVRVNVLAPGFTDTELVAGLSEKVVEQQLSKILMHRKARPEEIANVAAFLLSDLSSYVTGQVWRDPLNFWFSKEIIEYDRSA